MKGNHHIVVQNKRVKYDFVLRRNITVLRGDSATGKTNLIEMIREYTNNGASSSIELICDKACYVLEGATWHGQLSVMKDSIVFIDEGNPFVLTDNFSSAIQQTDNYYVIVSRELCIEKAFIPCHPFLSLHSKPFAPPFDQNKKARR